VTSSSPSSGQTEPQFITYLRGCSTDSGKTLAATFVGRTSRGLGVRPRVLSHQENGEKVYGLSGPQVARILAMYDAKERSLHA
jgi:hypothetical protein